MAGSISRVSHDRWDFRSALEQQAPPPPLRCTKERSPLPWTVPHVRPSVYGPKKTGRSPISDNLFGMFFFKTPTKMSS
jgi:hypothetical protein